jgi:branched-chain amino acid transport system permease protein
VSLETLAQHVLNGLQLGSFFALIAVGYSMVYGVLLLINFAHGDIFMVAAYVGMFIGLMLLGAYDISLPFGLPSALILPLTVVVTMAATAAVGVTIERVAYRPLRKRGAHRLYLVITALMCGLFLQYANLNLLGASDRRFPDLFEKRTFDIAGLSVTNVRVLVVLLSFVAMGAVGFFVQRTRWGMAMRAISYDRLAAPLMGVSVDRIVVLTFVIGGALAGLAGVMWGTAFPVLNANMGLLVGWQAFIAAVLGGIGSIKGAVVGGYLLGFTQVVVVASPLPTSARDLVTFSILLLVLTVRPNGLYGVARRTKV